MPDINTFEKKDGHSVTQVLLYLFSGIFLGLFLLKPQLVYADDNFDISYNIFYSFLESGTAWVTQTSSITNKKTNLYASEYSVNIGGNVKEPISGYDNKGPLSLQITKENKDRTNILVKFNQQVVGTGNKLTFTLNYQLTNLTNQIGRIKEISIPKPGNESSVINYQVKIAVPKKYGPVIYVKPKINYDQSADSYLFNFNDSESKNGILIGFGDVAHFKFYFKYHLDNSSLINRQTEIALPPDTQYQQVIYESLTPQPSNVTIDKDGNWLALYFLLPKQKIEVVASGSALIYSSPRIDFTDPVPSREYLTANKYWEVDSFEVKNISKNLKSAQDVYNYLIANFKYDYSRVNKENKRLGAKTALLSPDKVICMEFTDSFIALTRAIGIPSREINGYAYTLDEYLKPLSLVADVLHSWPEYWDQEAKIWRAVDPTWGSTAKLDYFSSLDLNHFVFVRHGVSSVYPVSAGGYKENNTDKNIEVAPDTNLPDISDNSLEFTSEVPQKVISGGFLNFIININNKTGVAKYNIPVKIIIPNFQTETADQVINLPPFAKTNIDIKLASVSNKYWGKNKLSIRVGTVQKDYLIEVIPSEFIYMVILVIFFVLCVFMTCLIIRKKYVTKRKS